MTSDNAKTSTVEEVAKRLRDANRILVVSHMRPDGDCYGSATALIAGLRALGKTAQGYNVSGIPKRLAFLPNVESISDTLPGWTPDVTVFVDCGNIERVSPEFKPVGTVINIDHHATNDQFGDLNYIDIKTTSVGEQIFNLFKVLNVELTADIATSIYTSLSDDSGNFRYPNTTAQTFRVASELVDAGANPSAICSSLYETKSRQEMDLSGRILSRVSYGAGGSFAWSELRWQDYTDVGGAEHEPDGMSAEIRSIEGVEAAILFHELEDGTLRASARGRGKVDCTRIAGEFDGGGHFNAAGFRMSGEDYESLRNRAVEFAAKVTSESLNP